MKKWRKFCLTVAVVCAALALFSCSDGSGDNAPTLDQPYPYNSVDGGQRLKTDGEMLYFKSSLAMDATFQKLNPATGRITDVCSDPLCAHKPPECPLAGLAFVDVFYVNDGRLWFWRNFSYKDEKTKQWVQVCDGVSYDVKKEKLHVLKDYPDGLTSFYLRELFTEEYRFFYEYLFDEEREQGYFALCREDLRSGDVTRFDSEMNLEGVTERLVFALDDRIYFTDGRRIFSRTMDNTDEVEHCTGVFGETVRTDGTAVYYEIQGENGYDVYRLESVNDSTGGVRLIESCSQWNLTGKYLYYVDMEKRILGESRVSGYASPTVEYTGTEIRRCGHTGEGDELVFAYTGEWFNSELRGLTVLGDSIYGFWHYWEDVDGDGVFQDGDQKYSTDILRIDTNTGEVEILTRDVK